MPWYLNGKKDLEEMASAKTLQYAGACHVCRVESSLAQFSFLHRDRQPIHHVVDGWLLFFLQETIFPAALVGIGY